MGTRSMTLAELLAPESGVALATPFADKLLGGVCLDSREVVPGDLYVAVGGASTHGIRHADGALRRGAVAVAFDPHDVAAFDPASDEALARLRDAGVPLVEVEALAARAPGIAARFHAHPASALTIVAVTGTDGKTSVCRFVAAALEALGTPCGYIGTLGWGRGEHLAGTALTTPDALALQRMLAALRDGGARAVALEASSHALDLGRLDALALDVAVLTNLGRDHLDHHGDLDAYRRAKAKLFSRRPLRAMVVNGEDELGRELADGASREASRPDASGEPVRLVVFHGIGEARAAASRADAVDGAADRAADRAAGGNATTAAAGDACDVQDAAVGGDALHLHAADIRTTGSGLSFTLLDGGERFAIESPLMGRFNVDNLLACHGVLRALGHAAAASAATLATLAPVAGRMEHFATAGHPLVLVDYAHTPQALAAAIAAARDHCRGELWVVFGCGGDRDRGKRGPMGRAAEAADHVVVTDDNPRGEASADIIAAVMEGMAEPARARAVPGRGEAIAHAVRGAGTGDVVLVAGKGHEDYQIVGDRRLAFSDRERVHELLAEGC